MENISELSQYIELESKSYPCSFKIWLKGSGNTQEEQHKNIVEALRFISLAIESQLENIRNKEK